uniref:Putative secreted peptide n=1 Tax=Anopheles braziliensis TaxID=58242 RepID=A0A2M3ZNU1_9DIPT
MPPSVRPRLWSAIWCRAIGLPLRRVATSGSPMITSVSINSSRAYCDGVPAHHPIMCSTHFSTERVRLFGGIVVARGIVES